MSRRYPNRRHVEFDLGPERRRRRRLNRMSVSMASLLALVIVATALWTGAGEVTAPEQPAGNGVEALVEVAGAVPVNVVRIIDGDTLVVRSLATELTVRLYGVDTPERGEACFTEATERLKELAGAHVQLLPDARLADRYDRQLRYVYSASGELIDLALVAEGLGRAWTEDGGFREEIIAAEAQARGAGNGCLWAPSGNATAG